MIALLGLLKHHEILVEHLLLGECDAVYTYELLALLVAAPVCACKRSDLHSLYRSRIGDMRTTAQIGESALCVRGDMPVLKLADKLALIRLATVTEQFQCIRFADVGSHYCILFPCKFEHFFLDLWKLRGRDFITVGIDVVIKTVVDSRSDAEFYARIQSLKSLGQKMSRTVPEGMLSFRVIPLEELYCGVLLYGAGDVPFLTVDRCGQNVLCKPGADTFGYGERRHAGFKLLYRIIGKSYVYHIVLMSTICDSVLTAAKLMNILVIFKII